ncbi:MAG: hypothetical protein JWN26_577 [Candidatus Saccharibacteria bacterium]|nr:hypothetical protein [Candidatus Saccharibacteria bacterium]
MPEQFVEKTAISSELSSVGTDPIDQEIRALEASLQGDNRQVTTEFYDSSHISALAGELAKLDHPDMSVGAADVEYIPQQPDAESRILSVEIQNKSPVEQVIESARAVAAEQAAEAIEHSEFTGPEVESAVKNYYTDHEVTLKLLGTLVEGSPDDAVDILNIDEKSLGIESDLLRLVVQQLARLRIGQSDEKFRELAAALCHDALFREPCVGQSTLTDKTIEGVVEEMNRLQQLMYPSEGPYAQKPKLIDAGWIRQSMENANNEVRPAGQLLFHNTPYGRDISGGHDKSLQGRARQRQSVKTGHQERVRMVTSADEGHSDNIHWSELYDPITYKYVDNRTPGIEQVPPDRVQGVTFAIPLAEIIEQAPIGRGIRYAVVEGKPGAVSLKPDESSGGPTGNIGVGSPDAVGRSASIDRVFWASEESRDRATDYEVSLWGNDTVINNPATGQAESSIYMIQSGVDRLWNYRFRRERIVEGSLEDDQLQADGRNLSEKDFLDKYGAGILAPQDSDTDEVHPKAVFIDDLKVPSADQTAVEAKKGGDSVIGRDPILKDRVSREVMVASAEPVIHGLQEESRRRFSGKYVVPLRAIYAEFMNGSDNIIDNQYGENVGRLLRRA